MIRAKTVSYGTTTEVTPLQFAVYETALKAIYAHWFVGLMLRPDLREAMECYHYHHHIGSRNKIAMPCIKDEECTQEFCNAAAEDYHYCSKLLGGLYYDLLD